jgi:hypothetical protein
MQWNTCSMCKAWWGGRSISITFQAGFHKWSKAMINTEWVYRPWVDCLMNSTVRTLLFMLLFGVGVGALALATLCNDVHVYFHQRRTLAQAETQLRTLRDLNAEFDGLLAHMETEPNTVRRLVPIVLGRRPEEPNSVFPEAALSVLMMAKQTITSYKDTIPIPEVPVWVERIRMGPRRRAMFASGGGPGVNRHSLVRDGPTSARPPGLGSIENTNPRVVNAMRISGGSGAYIGPGSMFLGYIRSSPIAFISRDCLRWLRVYSNRLSCKHSRCTAWV